MSDAPEGYPKHIAHVDGLKLEKSPFREYPKHVRHPDGAEKIVDSREEEERFLEKWECVPPSEEAEEIVDNPEEEKAVPLKRGKAKN